MKKLIKNPIFTFILGFVIAIGITTVFAFDFLPVWLLSAKAESGYSGVKSSLKKFFKEYQLKFTPLMKKEAYVYIWHNHKFANREKISIEELSEYPCITFDQSNDSNFYLTEEALSDYDFKKVIKTSDRATAMELIADLQGYSIGCGLLSAEDVILKGLVSIKLEEEDPLSIGYIVRESGNLSEYGKYYTEELLKYKQE